MYKTILFVPVYLYLSIRVWRSNLLCALFRQLQSQSSCVSHLTVPLNKNYIFILVLILN